MLGCSLKAGIADINDKKISNVQKDTEIKALQEKFPPLLLQLLGVAILLIVAALFSLVRRG
jgi:hypothetical protein